MEDGGDVLELAVLADDAALAVRLDGFAEDLLARRVEPSPRYSPKSMMPGEVVGPGAAYGFEQTTATAARRSGRSSLRSPSTMISSRNVAHLRIWIATAASSGGSPDPHRPSRKYAATVDPPGPYASRQSHQARTIDSSSRRTASASARSVTFRIAPCPRHPRVAGMCRHHAPWWNIRLACCLLFGKKLAMLPL